MRNKLQKTAPKISIIQLGMCIYLCSCSFQALLYLSLYEWDYKHDWQYKLFQLRPLILCLLCVRSNFVSSPEWFALTAARRTITTTYFYVISLLFVYIILSHLLHHWPHIAWNHSIAKSTHKINHVQDLICSITY